MGAVLGFLTHPCTMESGLPARQGPGWVFAGFGLSAASSRPCFPPGVGWEGFGSAVCCFMPGDDLGQKCWNHLKGTFSLSLPLCSVKVLAGLPLTAVAVGQSQGLSDLQGSGCGQHGGDITSGFPVSCGRLLLAPAEGSSIIN